MLTVSISTSALIVKVNYLEFDKRDDLVKWQALNYMVVKEQKSCSNGPHLFASSTIYGSKNPLERSQQNLLKA